MSGSNLSEGFWCGYNIFSNIKKWKNSNKKVEKSQKLINVVQKKNKAKQKKLKSVLSCRKAYSRMCTQNIRKSKYTQKISRVTEY